MGGGTKEKPVSHWGKGAPRVRTKAFWTDAVKWNAEQARWLNQPCDPKFRAAVAEHPRPRIFPSLCDWLDDEVPIEWLADFLKLIHDTPNLDWLLLTKRPENFQKRLAKVWDGFYMNMPVNAMVYGWHQKGFAPHNVWIGVSVEDQQRACERIPLLLRIPAKVHFLSAEPLLGPVDLYSVESSAWPKLKGRPALWDLNWVIIGGESGANRRDCGLLAIEDLASQCAVAKVPVFVKQDCAFKPGQRGRISDEIWALKQFPLTPNLKSWSFA